METKEFETDAIIPPGELLAEELEHRGISVREFAQKIGISPRTISGILVGEKPITAEVALRMEDVLGASARMWLNLETDYRLALAKRRIKQTA